jgi:alpha-glucosidase
MLSFYRRVLRLRRDLHGPWSWLDAPEGVLAFRRGDDTVIAVNMSGAPIDLDLPWPAEVTIVSDGAMQLSGTVLHLGVDAGTWVRHLSPN